MSQGNIDNFERFLGKKAASVSLVSPRMQAGLDYKSVGSNLNPYDKYSADWADYEKAFQRIWAESNGVSYEFG